MVLEAGVAAARAEEKLRRLKPRLFLNFDGNPGQRAFLSSDHRIRVLIPGNGFGKTTALAADIDMLIQKDDPYKPGVLTTWPSTCVWLCKKYGQFEEVKSVLERKVFTAGWTWNDQKHTYTWPNNGRLVVFSADGNWEGMQGIEADLFAFDEHPERQWWNEAMRRFRGSRKTRYVVAATMTQGVTWFVEDIIKDWERHHRELGLTNSEARAAQKHPEIWLWDVGGIRDNPSTDEATIEHHERQGRTMSDKEHMVRMEGGYADFSGDSVFDPVAVKEQRQNIREVERTRLWPKHGSLRHRDMRTDPASPAEDGRLNYSSVRTGTGSVRVFKRPRAVQQWVSFVPEGKIDRGRITVWQQPDPEASYVCGADFAYGLEGRDYDAAVVLKKRGDGTLEQVAEAEGHWGDVFFAETLFRLCVWYWNAFVVGERQVGLPCLRRLYDEFGYQHMYRGRQDGSRSRRPSDLLGHHRAQGDVVIPNLRLAISRGEVIVRSATLLKQLSEYQYSPKGKRDPDNLRSYELRMGAPAGKNDDLVMALAYALHGAGEVSRFSPPPRRWAPGSMGDIDGRDRLLEPDSVRSPFALR